MVLYVGVIAGRRPFLRLTVTDIESLAAGYRDYLLRPGKHFQPPIGGIYSSPDRATPSPLNQPGKGRQNPLNLLNPGRSAAPKIP